MFQPFKASQYRLFPFNGFHIIIWMDRNERRSQLKESCKENSKNLSLSKNWSLNGQLEELL